MLDRPLFTFKIHGLSPNTLGMKHLSRYLAELSDLLGSEDQIHFERVSEGSAELKWWPEEQIEQDVRKRLSALSHFYDDHDASRTILSLNKRLANDNATAEMIDPQGIAVADFPGKNFKDFANVPAFWQDDFIQGTLIRIGGKDASIHAHFDCGGSIVTGVTLDRKTARRIVQHFLGPTLRLSGQARWSRSYLGEWNLIAFKVQSFEVLEDESLIDSIDDLGQILSDKIGDSDDPLENLTDEDLQ